MIYLFLNSISTGEVVIILIFVLMFFGSKNIPGMARSVGKGLRQLRDATDDIKRDIRHSVDGMEKEVKKNMSGVDFQKDAKDAIDSVQKNLDNIIKKPKSYVQDNVKEFKDSVLDSSKKPFFEKRRSENNVRKK